MGRHAELQARWGDGDHTFRLGIGQIRELQEKTDAGPLELFRRMFAGTWKIDDVRETIRLGLIGANVPPLSALKLVERYVDERPLAESVEIARAILGVVLLPIEDDPLGKAKPTMEATAQQNSPSSASTETGPQSDSAQPKSTNLASGNSAQPLRDGNGSTDLRSPDRHQTPTTPAP